MPALIHNGTVILAQVDMAETVLTRSLGLMGRRSLPPGQGLLIRPCRSIHTCFMRFDLDVIFVDRNWRITTVVRELPPWRHAWGGWNAVAVIEVQSGWLTLPAPGTQVQLAPSAA